MRVIFNAAIAMIVLMQCGLAQMRTGMGNGVGVVGRMAGQAGDMMPGPVVGPDGTAYVLGSSTSNMMGNSQTSTQLMAINPLNGHANWTLPITGTMISLPVISKDGGTIYLTTSEPATARKSSFLIIAVSATSARVSNRIDIDSALLSVPSLTPDGQTIYFVAGNMSMLANNGPSAAASGAATLYAFTPTGAMKFNVGLN